MGAQSVMNIAHRFGRLRRQAGSEGGVTHIAGVGPQDLRRKTSPEGPPEERAKGRSPSAKRDLETTQLLKLCDDFEGSAKTNESSFALSQNLILFECFFLRVVL